VLGGRYAGFMGDVAIATRQRQRSGPGIGG